MEGKIMEKSMNKLIEIYAVNGEIIAVATDFAKALLNQSNGKNDNLKRLDFKGCSIPVGPSARIFQICEVIRHVCNGNDFSSAFSQVASGIGITENSVRDKCCRQLGLTMSEFKALVVAHIRQKDMTIVGILRKSVSSRTPGIDLSFINKRLVPGSVLNNKS